METQDTTEEPEYKHSQTLFASIGGTEFYLYGRDQILVRHPDGDEEGKDLYYALFWQDELDVVIEILRAAKVKIDFNNRYSK